MALKIQRDMNAEQGKRRFRFNLKTLMGMMIALAVLFGVVRHVGWPAFVFLAAVGFQILTVALVKTGRISQPTWQTKATLALALTSVTFLRGCDKTSWHMTTGLIPFSQVSLGIPGASGVEVNVTPAPAPPNKQDNPTEPTEQQVQVDVAETASEPPVSGDQLVDDGMVHFVAGERDFFSMPFFML
ncbi:MAG: hypothetical protein N2C14_12865, partial [Planctomycetales bacterium]